MIKGIYLKSISMVLVLAMASAGCSTVFGRHHDEQMVTFDANVPEVEINCSGKRTMTPGSIPLKQSKSHSCLASKEGYERKSFNIRSGTSWSGFGHSTATNTALWGWWTLGIGTGIGWLIDWPSGAMRNLKEENVYLEMREKGTTSTARKVLDKTIDVGKSAVKIPVDAARGTTEAVLDTAIHDTATQMGVDTGAEDEK